VNNEKEDGKNFDAKKIFVQGRTDGITEAEAPTLPGESVGVASIAARLTQRQAAV
jgi:hypothetical protein